MFPSMFESTTIPVLEQVVNFSQARHEVLAGNVANMDTPGYRARDLSPEQFQASLKEAIDAGKQTQRSMSGEDGSRTMQVSMGKVRDTMENLLYHDNSNDSLEQQVAEISKNQMQHNMALTILTSQFRLLQTAISERV